MRRIVPFVTLVTAAGFGNVSPASATGIGSARMEWCGDWIACVTGYGVGLDSWRLTVGGTECTSTSCRPYTALDVWLDPVTPNFLYAVRIPPNAFDACMSFTDGFWQSGNCL